MYGLFVGKQPCIYVNVTYAWSEPFCDTNIDFCQIMIAIRPHSNILKIYLGISHNFFTCYALLLLVLCSYVTNISYNQWMLY